MRTVLLLGVRPIPWAKASQAERDRIKAAIDDWFDELTAAGTAVDHLRFQGWKDARTVRIEAGGTTDAPGPLLVGPNDGADAVLVGQVVIEARSLTAAVAVAKTWPVPDAVVEVRPLPVV